MKLCVKKSYCPSCQKLVTCHEGKDNNHIGILCSKCGRVIWTRDGIRWRYLPEST